MLAIPILAFLATTTYLVVGTVITRRRYSSGTSNFNSMSDLEPVSILKPLKGWDENLEANLESFFQLDYPQYELIFSIADSDDPAIHTVHSLIRKYPKIPTTLIIGAVQVGPNPKVNNLMKGFFKAQYDLVLISDSQIRLEKEQLRHIVQQMDARTGVVTSPVVGVNSKGIGGSMEALELTTYVCRILNFINYLGAPVVLGKTILIKKSVAARFGGLRTLSHYIAEDYYTGVAVKKLGLKVTLAVQPLDEVIGYRSIKEYAERFIRWGRIRKAQSPIVFCVESYLCSFISPVIGSIALASLLGVAFFKVFLGFLLAHFTLDLFLIRKINPELFRKDIWIAWLLRYITNTFLYGYVYLGRRVRWRGQTITIEKGGLIKVPDDLIARHFL